MSTNAAHPTNAALFRREADIFSHIRGMEALLQAPPEKRMRCRPNTRMPPLPL